MRPIKKSLFIKPANMSIEESIMPNTSDESRCKPPTRSSEMISEASKTEMQPPDAAAVVSQPYKSYQELLVQAKTAMQDENYGEAVDLYAKALELMNKENLNQLSLPFAPLFYAYGTCLLSYSIQQSSVLGDAVQDSNGDADVEMADEVSGAMVEKTMQVIDDLQVAWEVLDTARLIYEKAIEEDSGLNQGTLSLSLANVYSTLAEVSMESDAFDNAIQDFLKALDLRKRFLSEGDRAIPEIIFKLGMAHELAENYEEAKRCFQQALDLLKDRNSSLKKSLHVAEISDDKKRHITEEIADLESLFPDLETKIEELAKPEAVSNGDLSSASDTGASTSAVATDISNLVKKKNRQLATIYKDDGVSEELVGELQGMFNRMKIDVSFKSAQDLLFTNWEDETKILVIPGGRDEPYVGKLGLGFGTRILDFLESQPNCVFLGLCAGAYFGSKVINFQPMSRPSELDMIECPRLGLIQTTASGPIFPDSFRYHSENGSRILPLKTAFKDLHCYYNGGCTFSDFDEAEVNVIAWFKNDPVIIERAHGPWGNKIVLSGVHLEVEGHSHFPQMNSFRRAMLQFTRKRKMMLLEYILK